MTDHVLHRCGGEYELKIVEGDGMSAAVLQCSGCQHMMGSSIYRDEGANNPNSCPPLCDKCQGPLELTTLRTADSYANVLHCPEHAIVFRVKFGGIE